MGSRSSWLALGVAVFTLLSGSQTTAQSTPEAESEPIGPAAQVPLAIQPLLPPTEYPSEPEQRFDFHIFSDTNARFGHEDSKYHSEFAIGGIDFFGTAELGHGVRALSESVLEILAGGPVFDLERIYLEWSPGSWLTLRLGRDHILVGQYMATYHHALLFQLATSRPLMLEFEDGGGLLPAHQIGLEALGEVGLGSRFIFGYAVGMGNGRGRFNDDILSTFDEDEWKSLLLRLSLSPTQLRELEFGVSGYFDNIPSGGRDPDTDALRVPNRQQEFIGGAHVVYSGFPFEMHAEAYYVNHRDVRTDESTQLAGGFAQFAYTVRSFSPYVRGEAFTRDASDSFYDISGAANRFADLRVGVRYGLTERAVLKLEFSTERESKSHKSTLQAAFGL